MISYSRVSTYNQCPYKYRLRYLEGLETYPDLTASNPLYLGTALHDGIETGDISGAIQKYLDKYPIITDEHIEESTKLEVMIERMLAFVPQGGTFEYRILNTLDDFIGFVDYLVRNEDGTYDVYDFKYSAKPESYLESAQVHIYRYYLEKEGKHIRNLYYLVAPKVNIKPRKNERREDFRKRIREELKDKQPVLIDIEYSSLKVWNFLEDMERMLGATEFPKVHTGLCPWCEYRRYCDTDGKEDLEIMKLPANIKVAKGDRGHVRIWIYGQPFAGKTYLANQFPDVLMLNTDGNTKYVDAPRIRIKDEVSAEGRLTKRTLAWDIFKDTITELEKGSEFKTIVLDLVEDTYEMCRKWGYTKLNIEHESEDSFKAWDFIRTEFLSTLRRFLNLNYDIILISHEDISRDIMKKSGDKVTAIKPNISDKIALKLAGMVDIVARVIKVDDDTRVISFKTNDVIFGGGRIAISRTEIPCSYDNLIKAIDDHLPEGKKEEPQKPIDAPKEEGKDIPSPKQEEKAEDAGEQPRRRARTPRPMPDGGGDIVQAGIDATEEEDAEPKQEEDKPAGAEAPKRTRVRRQRTE